MMAVPSLFIQEPSTLHQPSLTARDDNEASQQNVKLQPLTLKESAPATTDANAASHQNIELDQALKKLKQLQEKVNNQKKKIKCLNETVRRQNLKTETFKEMIIALKENNLVTHENCILLQQCAGPKDFILRQINKAKGMSVERKYSEEIRKFALTLNFMSPKAYDFVRTSYDLCLPHPRTSCKWYEHVNAEPGFCKEAFETLKLKVESSNEPVIFALILDEMSIRKSLCWDPRSQKYYGRVNTGIDIESDSVEVASQKSGLLAKLHKWEMEITGCIFFNKQLEW